MKKILRNAVAASLAALVSFSMISCGDTEEEEPYPVDSDLVQLHPLILPSGTGVKVPAWSKATDGVQNLPEVVTEFTTKESNFTELNGKTNRTAELKAAVQKAIADNMFNGRPAKNVIIVFADGWGESHTVGARQYYGELIMDELPYHAPINHDAYLKASSTALPCEDSDLTTLKRPTDSTAGGTAINTGFTTRYGYCDLDIKGTAVKNLSELARERGMLVGNVTNDCSSDATPATVLCHTPTRDDGDCIDAQQYIASPELQMGRYGFGGLVTSPSDPADFSAGNIFSAWYTSNVTSIKSWAISMLNYFDGKSISDAYDMSKWTEDRRMVAVNGFAEFINSFEKPSGEGVGNDKRYVVKLDKKHKFEYTPSKTTTAPCLGYKLGYGKTKRETYPNYAELVASTLYALDTQAKANGDCGFFCLIENTCPDGWGHAGMQYDCLNEVIMTDEGIAVALKYVLENPDTLLVVTADHETGGVTYEKGWESDYTLITSGSGGDHSPAPIPVYAFGAKAELWEDSPRIDFSTWTPDQLRIFAAGTPYPKSDEWRTQESSEPKAKYSTYPKILRNRTTGIRISRAMGFTKFGDLDGDGILDPDTESDSVVDFKNAGVAEALKNN